MKPKLLDLFCGAGGKAIAEAIPPAFTEYVGGQLMAQLEEMAA